MNTRSSPAAVAEGILPMVASLRAASQAAQARHEPLVVMVTLKGCAFCEVVRKNYLGPMSERGEVYAVQIDMLDRNTPLQDLAGHSSTGHTQARAWGVRMAPTLLFLDGQGREIAERMEGMTLADFYGAYLEQRLQQARQVIRQRR